MLLLNVLTCSYMADVTDVGRKRNFMNRRVQVNNIRRTLLRVQISCESLKNIIFRLTK